MRAIDLHHLGNAKVICCWEVDGVLVDPGPESTAGTLLEALDGSQPQAILLTHIHFDHAGATGALLRRWPELPVYVHERGLPHLADPGRLVASAARLYGGEEELRRLWGEVVPVPEERMTALSGGETLLGAWEVAYTPGHASHHVSFLHQPSRVAFVGDVAGVRVPPSDFTLAPTPPPDVDIQAWENSLDLIASWSPEALALTHFGRADAVQEQLARVRAALHEQLRLASAHGREAFMAGMHQRIEQGAGDLAAALEQAAPPEHLFLGLERYLRR